MRGSVRSLARPVDLRCDWSTAAANPLDSLDAAVHAVDLLALRPVRLACAVDLLLDAARPRDARVDLRVAAVHAAPAPIPAPGRGPSFREWQPVGRRVGTRGGNKHASGARGPEKGGGCDEKTDPIIRVGKGREFMARRFKKLRAAKWYDELKEPRWIGTLF